MRRLDKELLGKARRPSASKVPRTQQGQETQESTALPRYVKPSKPAAVRALALDAGLTPDSNHPGYYRDERYPEFLYSSDCHVIPEPECWTCNDIGFVKYSPPVFRRSDGPWVSEVLLCPDCHQPAERGR